MLCHEHAITSKLPYLNAKESLQAGVEDRTDALMRQFSNKKDQKPGKKLIKRLDGENKWLQGLKGDGLSKYERQLGNLFEESGDPAISIFGKAKSLGFCAPCSIQKEVRQRSNCSFLDCVVIRFNSISLPPYNRSIPNHLYIRMYTVINMIPNIDQNVTLLVPNAVNAKQKKMVSCAMNTA